MKTLPLVYITAVLGVAAHLHGAADSTTSDSSTNSPPPTAAPAASYTDQGRTNYNSTTTNFGSSHYYDGISHGHLSGLNSYQSSISIQHRPIYFPPSPPPLGEFDFKRRVRVPVARFSPPLALTTDVYELFYAPLSTLLFTEDLSRKRRERLDGYHTARTALLTELRSALEGLQTTDAATRESRLSGVAREQAARLATAEITAEELRNNFTRGSFLESSVDWNDTRSWRLGDDTRWESQLDEIKVMRGAAAFQEGLSSDQRRLLREMEMELADGLSGPTDEIALSAPGPFLYFSPETARIRLPAELPAELVSKIESYKAEKTALKTDLRKALYDQDRAWFNFKRIAALKALAEKQAPGFAMVEQLAEEIRRGLAPLPNPARPPALSLPASLATRIASYHQRKSALQALLVAKQEEIKTALPEDRVEYTRVSDSFVLNVIPSRRSSAPGKDKRPAIVAALPAFNEEQTRLFLALAREKEALRVEVMKTVTDLSATRSIDQLLREFSYAIKKQEAWELYREYEIAVLEPGLSPAQRRLLFGAALEKLELPLAN